MSELGLIIDAHPSREELIRALDRADGERSLYKFIKLMWHLNEPGTPFVGGWVLEAICEHLEAVTSGEITRLLMNVPPGSTKSSATFLWSAWEWGPKSLAHLRYLCVAYAGHLTSRDNRRFRNVILSPLYRALWGDRFQISGESTELVSNNRSGWRLASSVGGVGTGERADRILMDDPNRPPTDTDGGDSDAVMRSTQTWFREVMPDRLNHIERSAIIVIQQRISEIDVSGTILELGQAPPAEQWTPGDYVHLCIPNDYDPARHCVTVLGWQDPRMEEGEPAWPERFPPDALRRIREFKGVWAWASQYQQMPAPRGGGIIKDEWWKLWEGDEFPPYGTCVGSVDTAFKEHEEADYSAMTVWGAFQHPDTGRPAVMLRDAWQERLNLALLVRRVTRTCREHKVDTLLIEDSARGGDVRDEMYRLIGRREVRIVLIKAAGDKIQRLNATVPVFENGIIYAPEREWSQMVIDQISRFPRGKHDDLCFVAGTLIATDQGQIPIENVRAGMRALTPYGWRPIVDVGFTGVRSVCWRLAGCRSGGLEGTPGHPVFTADLGFVPLDTISVASKIRRLTICDLIRLTRPKQWNLWASYTDEWEESADITCLNPQATQGAEPPKDCMLRFGSTSLGRRSRRDMRSITLTMIRSISILKIWSAYRKACIAGSLRKISIARLRERILPAFGLPLLHGIALMMEGLGIGRTLSPASPKPEWYRFRSRDWCPVFGAELPLHTKILGADSVVRFAGTKHQDGGGGSIVSFTRILRPVYNLKVAGANCYYANKILVHNCDTVSMAITYLRATGVATRRDEHEEGVRARQMYRKQPKPVYDV